MDLDGFFSFSYTGERKASCILDSSGLEVLL